MSGGGGSMAIGGAVTGATTGGVLYTDGSGQLAQQASGFFFDASNTRLGIGTATPAVDLSVKPDTDSGTILGRLRIDARTTDVAFLSHFDQTGVGDGHLQLNALGDVFLNAKSARTLGFRVNGSTIASVTSTQLTLSGVFIEFSEQAAPAAPSVNRARLYCVDNGSGKTQLAVIFNTGAAQILATEP
jgi:hypothetical protein